MKYTAYFAGFLLFLFPAFAFAATCDQSFEGTLRVGQGYKFSDEFTNSTDNALKIAAFRPEFNEQYDYDGAAGVMHYGWTPWISSRKGIIQPGEQGIIVETDTNYPIIYSPPVRSKNNLTVRYVVDYRRQVKGVWNTNIESHSECKSYEITWCGDGVVDSQYGELCDQGAQNGKAGSSCSATCTPVTTPPLDCNRGNVTLPLTAPINSGTAGLCQPGVAVNGFGSTITGTATNFFWACGASAIGGACSATYDTSTNGSLCTRGNIPLPLTGVITVATPGLCPVGQTAERFTATPNGTGTDYSWACSGSAVGGSCAASFTGTPVTPTPYSACMPASPTTDCSANQYATLAACLVANPGASGRTCYLNNVAACNATRATQCPATVLPGICNSLTATATSSTTGTLTTNVTCTAGVGAGASPTFAINCGNGQTINAATGTCTYAAPGNFVASCTVNNTTPTPAACQLPISVTNGGGGGPGACRALNIQSSIQVDNGYRVSYTCTANPGVAGPNPSFRVDCGNGQSVGSDVGSCFYTAANTYNMACYVENSTDSVNCQKPIIVASAGAPLPGGGGGIGGGGGSGYCGNGQIDAGETCDAGSNGGVPISNGFCNNCRSGWTNPGACARGALDCPAGWTNPGGNGIDIYYRDGATNASLLVPKIRSIVGNGVNVFSPGDAFTIHANYPIYIGGLTAGFVNNNTGLITGSSVYRPTPDTCIGEGKMQLYENGPTVNCGDYTLFKADANGKFDGTAFIGDTSGIPAGQSSADVNPPRSVGSAVRENNFFVGLNYLIEPIPVRVARSAISNTAGGNAYVGIQVGYSVNSITSSFMDSLKKGNFTVTSSSKDIASSLSSATSEQAGKAVDANGDQNASITKFSQSSDAIAKTVVINSQADFDTFLSKVGDNPNLYTLAKGKVIINGNLQLSGVKTLVIDEGRLEINGNITYADANASWAFVIKQAGVENKGIVVASSVTDIAGVYIVLEGDMVGMGQTINPLAVDGNISANIAPLVNDRTYIRATQNSSALSTGVTINYSTRAFKNPPPLLSQYLDQYNLAKISR